MGKEIERKFLVRKDLWYALHKPTGVDIIQTYLHNEEGKIIRLRIAGSEAFLTVKGPVKDFTRDEFEYTIPIEDAHQILEIFKGNRIEKVRYKVEFKGHMWEVDEFFGNNDGLILAEIELKSQEEAFELPSWLGAEVTRDHRYFNSYLSDHPFTSW